MRSTQVRHHLLAMMCLLLGIAKSSTAAANTGELTWGQSCSPSASLHDDQSFRCDTSKRLSCDMRDKTCKCHHEERDFYNKAEDRCETKFGKFCSHSETFPTICVKNAYCDSTTQFCKCVQDADPNVDGSLCVKESGDDEANNSDSLRSFQAMISIAAFVVGVVWF